MNADFESAWRDLQGLPLDRPFETWSVTGRARKSFRVVAKRYKAIVVAGDEIDGERPVSRLEFERVFSDWPDYCAGRIPRSKLGNKCKNLTYTFTLLHWRDNLKLTH